MDLNSVFQTYIIGMLLNLMAGLIGWFVIRKLFEWLPNSADLHEKFRAVATEKSTNHRLAALTPLLFMSFYWLFFANLLWVAADILVEVLNWPDLVRSVSSRNQLNFPQVESWLEKVMPGIVIGRSALYLLTVCCVAHCFHQGLMIAKQCWEVYKSIGSSHAR